MVSRYTKKSIDRYIDTGCPTGSFLYAVLTNNLFGAISRADANNKPYLADICEYISNYAPLNCWGSAKKVKAWMILHRENREQAEIIAACGRERREDYYENSI